MNLDFIKTKKAMLDFAAKHNVKLTSTTLKDMKVEYSTKTIEPTIDFNALANETYSTATVIEGDARNVTIKNERNGFSTVIPFVELPTFCTEHELRYIDVESVLNKTWTNVAGYSFSTGYANKSATGEK